MMSLAKVTCCLFEHVALTDNQLALLKKMYWDNEPDRPICHSARLGSKVAMDYEVLAAYGLVQYREAQILGKPYRLYWLSVSGGLLVGDYSEYALEASPN